MIADRNIVEESHWYVAIVKNNTEKQSSQRLSTLGYDSYVPIQSETHLWKNGRRKVVDRIILPSMVFVKCKESERLAHIAHLPYIYKFLVDTATRKGGNPRSPAATIPESQMQKLMFVVGNSELPVTIERPPLHLGDTIRVIRGNLRGLEGHIEELPDGSTFIVIRINSLGCAKVKIDPIDVERIR